MTGVQTCALAIYKLYFDGKEMYDLRQYNTAFRYLDEYILLQDNDRSPYYAEAEYYLACSAYEMKRRDANKRLEYFCSNNPYSPRINRVKFLRGSIYFERNKFKEALEFFESCNPKNLSKEDKDDLYFQSAYCYLQLNDFSKAKSLFEKVNSQGGRYEQSATYYVA